MNWMLLLLGCADHVNLQMCGCLLPPCLHYSHGSVMRALHSIVVALFVLISLVLIYCASLLRELAKNKQD